MAMKWMDELSWVRHGESAYNELRGQKQKDPLYQEFVAAYDRNYRSSRSKRLARRIWEKYGLGVGDNKTPLTETGIAQSHATGIALQHEIKLPDVIFVSPHLRAHQTKDGLAAGWPDLGNVRMVEEPRLREQEHGLSLIYNDWRVFHTLHPEQKILRDMEGSYWYRYPQGENVPDVIERLRSFIGTLVRDYSEKRVLVVSHHLTILSFLAAIMRWDSNEFIKWDEEKKPINCGLTILRGDPSVGKEGQLKLEVYNKKLY